MKIKTKKQLNLPQLIEWAMENDVKHRVFQSNPNFDGVTYKLGFDIAGDLYFEESLTPTLLFTVEVEEEITEDTRLEKAVEVYSDDIYSHRATVWNGKSINFILKTNGDDARTETIHLINNDGTHTLIWKHDKGLVE